MLLCAPLRSQRPHTPLLEGSRKASTIACRCHEGKSIRGVLREPGSVVSSAGCNRKSNREGGILNLGSVHKPNREGGISNLGSVHKPSRERGKDFYAIANVLAPPEQRTSGQAQLSQNSHPPTGEVSAGNRVNQPDRFINCYQKDPLTHKSNS